MRRVAPVFLLAAAVALAGEKSPAPAESPGPAAEDALAAAKRDFDAVKAARGPAEQSKPDLLRLTAPEFQTTAPVAPRQQATPAELAARKKSANWLVDAMMKKPPQDPRAKVTEELEQLPGAADKAEGDDQTGQMAAAGKPAGPEFNPLARYMAGWMTPQDYTLLKPGLGGEVAADLATRGDPSLSALATDVATLGDKGSALDLSPLSRAAPGSLPAPQENPYLQGFALPPPSGAVFTPPASANAVLAPTAALITPPAEPAPAKSKTPDFVKPDDDAKYFKQLKRF